MADETERNIYMYGLADEMTVNGQEELRRYTMRIEDCE